LLGNESQQWKFFSFCRHAVTRWLILLTTELIQSQSHVTTDGQSASLSWNKAPIWDLRPDFYYCQTVACLLMWGALSEERMGLSFTIAAGPCQYRHYFPFRRFLRLAGLRWKYSTPPPHGSLTELIAPSVPIMTSRQELYRKHILSNSNSIVACVFVAAGTCLPSHCPETAAARTTENTVLLLLQALPSNGRCSQSHRVTPGLYATIFNSLTHIRNKYSGFSHTLLQIVLD
jgi:hypothetical protein